jgi:putative autotransporter adhesin-like protein
MLLRPALALFAATCLLGMVLSGCGVRFDNGPHTVQSRPVAEFDRVEVHGSANVTVHPGSSATLTVEGGEKVVDDVTTRVEAGTLIVESHDSSATIDLSDDDATVVVHTPALVGARVDGSGDLALPELDGERLEVRVDGSGDITGAGRLAELDATVDGSGDLDLGDVVAQTATVTVTGSGDAEVDATRTLHIVCRGSGDVSYRGHPTVTKDVSGSGDVSRED